MLISEENRQIMQTNPRPLKTKWNGKADIKISRPQ